MSGVVCPGENICGKEVDSRAWGRLAHISKNFCDPGYPQMSGAQSPSVYLPDRVDASGRGMCQNGVLSSLGLDRNWGFLSLRTLNRQPHTSSLVAKPP